MEKTTDHEKDWSYFQYKNTKMKWTEDFTLTWTFSLLQRCDICPWASSISNCVKKSVKKLEWISIRSPTPWLISKHVYLSQKCVCAFEPPASLCSGPLFTGEKTLSALVMALLTLCARLPPGCVAVSGIQYRTGGECVCVWGCWHKDSLFCPWRQVTFASGLICILSHYAGMLLLLLAGPLFPDKTHLKALEPSRCYLFLLLHVCIPPHTHTFFVIPSPSSPFPLFISICSLCSLPYLFSFFVSFVNFAFVSQSSVCWI